MKSGYALPFLIAGVLGMILTWCHARFFGDATARFVGIYIAVFGFPALVFVLLMTAELMIWPTLKEELFHAAWLWLLIGLLISYAPLAIYIFGPSIMGDR